MERQEAGNRGVTEWEATMAVMGGGACARQSKGPGVAREVAVR